MSQKSLQYNGEIYLELEPGLINYEKLNKMIREQSYIGEAKRLAQLDTINYNNIYEIRLEFQNIIKIDHLWVLPNLKRLSLKFNKIEKIENLEMLTNLIELDLSFNYIENIENLHSLKNLEILTLFNNCITELEHLDELENLIILSVGNNKLETYKGIERFRFLLKLHSLNLEGNPIAKDSQSFRIYIASFLPNLKYYNYKIINDDERQRGKIQYELELRHLEKNELEEINERKRFAKEQADEERLSSSFVELLNEYQLFNSLFIGDEDGNALLAIGTDCDPIIEEYRDKIYELTQKIYKLGLEKREQRISEIQMFHKCIDEARIKAQEIGIETVDKFLIDKDELFGKTKEILLKMEKETETIVDEPTDDYNVFFEEYQQLEENFFVNIDKIWQILMENEVQLTERIEEGNAQFGHTIQDMLNEFIEQSQTLFVQMRSEASTYSDSLYEIVSRFIAIKAAANDLNSIPEQLRECLDDKDVIVNLIAGSRDYHMQKLDSREDKLITRARNWATELVAQMHSDETNRNRTKVMEINYFLDKQREAFEHIKEEVVQEIDNN